jgi:hypothetical protein
MPCESEKAALDSANTAADAAKIDADAAWEKALNDAEAASAACGVEFSAGVLGGAAAGSPGGIAGALGGAGIGAIAAGVACLAGLYAARGSALDADAAYKKYENASSAAANAFTKYYLCMERCRLPPGGVT